MELKILSPKEEGFPQEIREAAPQGRSVPGEPPFLVEGRDAL